MSRIPLFLFVFVCTFLITSCKKDEPEELAELRFEFDFNVDGASLEFNKDYTVNGNTVSFDAANFYVGGIELKMEEGLTITLQDEYLLAGIGNTATLNNDLPLGKIISVKCFIGVDPETNAQEEIDFTSRPPEDPLAIKDPAMHWSWGTGYKFLRVDGDIDTTFDGTTDVGIAYHLATDNMLKHLEFNKEILLTSGENIITFSFDLVDFFDGVDLQKERDTHTHNNPPLAQLLRDNLEKSISVE